MFVHVNFKQNNFEIITDVTFLSLKQPKIIKYPVNNRKLFGSSLYFILTNVGNRNTVDKLAP